ncbi:MAG: leucyl aminopeptidase [Pseudomonadota bacterium]
MRFTLSAVCGAAAPSTIACDLLAIPVFEDSFDTGAEPLHSVDVGLGGLLAQVIAEEQFKGKANQTLQIHTHGKISAQRLLLIGAGSRADAGAGELRHIAARASKAARSSGSKSVGIALPALFANKKALQLAAEGALLGRYRFDRYLSQDNKRPDNLAEVVFAIEGGFDSDTFESVVDRAHIIAESTARTRDMVNEPASVMTPRRLADEAARLAAENGLEIKVYGRKECEGLGMGMFLAVASGSDQEPQLIHLSYRPPTDVKKRVCLVGKGITFDSGGLSLKPVQSMEDMKADMAGAATVLNAIAAAAKLRAPVEIHAVAPCTENMPSGKAYKIGDVLRSMAGKTVEIVNTDAEGRLILGDAIAYALRLDPAEVIDFATLTGACVVALGPHIAGVMSNNQGMTERWLAAAERAGEEMWRLPLPGRLHDQLRSDVADMKNTGDRWGGALTAGLFLKEFVGKTPWIHMDIAGPAHFSKEYGAYQKGGSGIGLATIIEYLTATQD